MNAGVLRAVGKVDLAAQVNLVAYYSETGLSFLSFGMHLEGDPES